MFFLSLLLSVVGCTPANSCEDYIDAARKCAEATGADTTVYDAEVVCGDWTEGDETNFGDWYQCRADAFDAADCSTSEGLQAGVAAAEACPQ